MIVFGRLSFLGLIRKRGGVMMLCGWFFFSLLLPRLSVREGTSPVRFLRVGWMHQAQSEEHEKSQ
jgi:hypothetical protein